MCIECSKTLRCVWEFSPAVTRLGESFLEPVSAHATEARIVPRSLHQPCDWTA